MYHKKDRAGEAVATMALALLLTPAEWLWNGFVGAKIWNWFVPAIFGIQEITTRQAFAVILVLSVFIRAKKAGHKSESDSPLGALIENIAIQLIAGSFALLTGWIYKELFF